MRDAAPRTRGATRRIARDAVAIAGLATEWVSLQVAWRAARASRAPTRSAADVRRDAAWKAAAVGALAALPPGPLGVAASALEAGLLAHIESDAEARLVAIALCASPAIVEWSARAGDRGGAQPALRTVVAHAARSLAAVTVKELGLALPRAGARAVLGAAAPVLGVALGAAWNALEMHRRLDAPVRTVRQLAPVVLAERHRPAFLPPPAPGPARWSRGALAAA